MSVTSLCACGREGRAGELTRFTCDVCRSEHEAPGHFVPGNVGSLDLGGRWRLDICRDCVRALIERAPDGAARDQLRRQAFGEGD